MVSTDSVHSLLKKLSTSFLPTSTNCYSTKVRKRELDEKQTRRLLRKCYDCLLFDYDDDEIRLDIVKCEMDGTSFNTIAQYQGVHVAEKYTRLVNEYLQLVGNEKACQIFSLLLPICHPAKDQPLPMIGHGDLPPRQLLTGDLLNESEVFRYTPLLAPPTSSKYTYYPQSLFSDCVSSAADSAFSELDSSGSNASAITGSTRYPVIPAHTYSQPPGTSRGTYHSVAADNERSTDSILSLYGALTNRLTSSDLPVSLELPPLDMAPVSFDYVQGRTSATEKHAVIAHSPVESCRPDSGLGEDIGQDVGSHGRRSCQPLSWELQRKVGGFVGCDIEEKPYLTEAGRKPFDLLYRLQLSCRLQIMSSTREDLESKKHLYVISMADLMKDVSILLTGVSSKSFYMNQSDKFSIRQGLVVSGMSAEALASVCKVLVDSGTYYYRLDKLSKETVPGLTITAFLRSISYYLSTYTAAILEVSPKARSPLHMQRLLKKSLQQIKLLAKLCYCDEQETTGYPSEKLPTGVDLLSYIYREAESYTCEHSYQLLLSLLYDTCQPYLRFLQDWVFHGRCSDPFEEFLVMIDPYKWESEDRLCWTGGYLLDVSRKKNCQFLGNLSESIYLGGKSLALLRKMVPDHEMLAVGQDPPLLDICLTEETQQHLRVQSTLYNERLKAMLKHKFVTRQRMLDEKVQKSVERIRVAQAVQAERLATIHKMLEDRRKKEIIRKKKLFGELKENMERAAALKTKEAAEEQERDAEMVKRLAESEQLQIEADAKLVQQARQELVEYYRLMNEAAAARERKALWRVRRHQLADAREQFLNQEQTTLLSQLQQLENGELSVVANGPIMVRPIRCTWDKPSLLEIKVQDEPVGMSADDLDGGRRSIADVINSSPLVISSSPMPAQLESHGVMQSFVHKDVSDIVKSLDVAISSAANSLAATDLSKSRLTAFDVSKDLEAALSASNMASLVANRSTKSVAGQHVSATSFDKEHLVRRPVRRSDPNKVSPQKEEHGGRLMSGPHSSSQSQTDMDTVMAERMLLRSKSQQMFASKESDEPDFNAVKMEKFRIINKRGHASHSSIQALMYYGTIQGDMSMVAEEVVMSPLAPIKLEEVEDTSKYDADFYRQVVGQPSLSKLNHRRCGDGQSTMFLYEHESLSTLLQQSVAASLTAQIALSNQALLSHFMLDLDFDKHMEVLHEYMLLAKGEFSLSFTLPLFEKLHRGGESRRLVSTYFLTDTLKKALQHVPLKANTFTDNLMIAKADVPSHMEAYSLSAFSWLSLTYKVAWPLNILITTEHMQMYEKIFSFMVSLKHISYLLADSWHSLKFSTQANFTDSESMHFRQIHLIRHDMQHFVKVIHGYLALQVTQVSWHQFQEELKKVNNLDELYTSHNRFIGRCLLRCFLSHKVQQIKHVVDGILKSIYKFHALLRLGHWEWNAQDEFVHTEYDAIAKAYLPFKEFTHFLNKVLTKMTESDKNQHLRELQMMLNFNGYYNKSTSARQFHD